MHAARRSRRLASGDLTPLRRTVVLGVALLAVAGGPAAPVPRALGATTAITPDERVAGVPTLCGVDASTLPRGVTLLPGTTEAHFRDGDPVERAHGEPACGPTLTVTPMEPPLMQSSFPGRGPRERIVIVLDAPISRITVASRGALSCKGTRGTLIALDHDGAEVARAPLQFRDHADCGSDQITFGVWGTAVARGAVIRTVMIDPPQPWSFPVGALTGYVTAQWVFGFPIGGQDVARL